MKAIAKTVSWLLVSGIVIALAGWYESGELTVGIVAAAWACALKTPLYWLHELCWQKGAEAAAAAVLEAAA